MFEVSPPEWCPACKQKTVWAKSPKDKDSHWAVCPCGRVEVRRPVGELKKLYADAL